MEIVAVDDGAGFWEDRDVVRTCLAESPPRVLPWFGYDDLGSQLFEESGVHQGGVRPAR